ncbi:hypothetical protein E2I00_015410 [Balaenoptera physalus]|uniref:Uncharacterized protein n=1 Tax=Balaenoptera physalus TaxID=9770 RepID=A0A643BQV1_BALPH|nr:hypothetical protein E2I00_015410 [Balaenoptera physalus]
MSKSEFSRPALGPGQDVRANREDKETLDPKETEGLQDVQGSGVERENMETMGLLDSMGKRAFMDFLGKREKRVIQDPR